MLFAGLDVRVERGGGYFAQGYYASMGFGVPGALGAQIGTGRRPLVLCGDGAFQMTGPEIAQAPRHGLNPIVLVHEQRRLGDLPAGRRARRICSRSRTGRTPSSRAPGAGAASASRRSASCARRSPTPSAHRDVRAHRDRASTRTTSRRSAASTSRPRRAKVALAESVADHHPPTLRGPGARLPLDDARRSSTSAR